MESLQKGQITFDKVSKQRVFELIRCGLYVLCFVGILIHLIEVDNSVFQTGKDEQNMIAMLLFAILLFVAQRVKLINWQSLAVTILYGVFVFYQTRMFYRFAPDLSSNVTTEKLTVWVLLMVITDMIVTKRIRDYSRMNLPLFAVFAISVALMAILGGEKSSVYNYICLLILFLVPIEKEEWDRIIRSLILAGIISFVITVILSEILNPFVPGVRWYGYFLNIGAFGEFLGLITALAVLSLVRIRKRFGRRNIRYVLALVWLLSVLAVVSLNGTTTYLLGAVLLAVVLLVFGSSKTGFPKLYLRMIALVIVILLGAIGILFIARIPVDSLPKNTDFANGPLGSLLRIALAGIYKIVDKILSFHDLINGARADYIQSSAMTFIHTFSSTRVGIFETFMKHTTFASGGGGLWYHGYFYPGAHNQFAQQLFEYGFLAGGVGILFTILAWISAIIGYIREKSDEYLAAMLLPAMMFGLWIGEVCTISYPITFFSLFVFAPVLAKPLPKRTESIWPSKKSLRDLTKQSRNAVFILSGCALFLSVFFIGKLIAVQDADVRDADKYITVSRTLEGADPGKGSGNGINPGTEEQTGGYVIMDSEYAAGNVKTAAWGGRGFAVIPFKGANRDDKLVLEFTACTDSEEPVRVKVCYEEEEEYITVTGAPQRYSVFYSGWPEDNNIVFVAEGGNGMQTSVRIGNVRVTNYGQ